MASPTALALLPGLPTVDPASGPTAGAPAATGDDDAYRVVFQCQSERSGQPLGSQVFCPVHVLDAHDAMSQPVLMLDPENPHRVAFNALHGAHGVHAELDNGPPTQRSRDNDVHQPHTTFRSVDQGAIWSDNPYDAPDAIRREGRQVFGEDNAATLDADGRIYLASLYAHREAAATPTATAGDFRYAVGLWKAGRISEPIDYSANVIVHDTGSEGLDRADSIHAIHHAGTARVLVLWRETDANETAEDAAGDLFVLWTDTGRGAVWTPLPLDPPVSACRSITNPVLFHGEVAFGCQPGTGYRFPANATQGLQIHAFDPTTGASRHVASTDIPGDHVRLVQRGDNGHLVAATAIMEEGRPRLYVAYGDADGRWSDIRDRTDGVTLAGTGPRVVDARVTAAAFRPDSGTIHLVYMERFEPRDGVPQRNPQAQYYKAFVVIHGEGPLLSATDLQMGQLNRADMSTASNSAGLEMFDDLHDDIAIWVDPKDGAVTEYIAFGDHGFVRFGRVAEEDPPFPPILGTANVPPVPLATAGANPAVYGAAAGILAAAMVARFIASRRRSIVEVDVKA